MYLHLGGDVTIKTSDIIGIFDLENTSIKKDTRLFLKKAEEKNRVKNVSLDIPKSFCVCMDKYNKKTVYISQISPTTLKKRASFLENIKNLNKK